MSGSLSRDIKNTESVTKHHGLTLVDREHLEIYGVTDVTSFDDNSVSLVTELGRLEIEGEGLKVSALDVEKGKIVLDGIVISVYYINDEKPKDKMRSGLFSKLVR